MAQRKGPQLELAGLVGRLVRDQLQAELGGLRTPTVGEYAERFLASRRARRLASAHDDMQRMRDHVPQSLKERHLEEVSSPMIRELVLRHRADDALAPRTQRQIYRLLHRMFADAVADGLIRANPCVLKRCDLPPIVDRDPAWRDTAVFAREELEQLLSDERIPLDRRVLIGLKGLGALRHSEAARLRWNHIVDSSPLSEMRIAKTKAKKPRLVPIHPVLQELLNEWRSRWCQHYRRQRCFGNDLVVPTLHANERNDSVSQRQFLRDLAAVGLRGRRGHDLRRTMITLARADGARDEVLKAITHGPKNVVIDMYTTWPWPVLCAEVLKLNVALIRVDYRQMAFSFGGGGGGTHRPNSNNSSCPGTESNHRHADFQSADKSAAYAGDILDLFREYLREREAVESTVRSALSALRSGDHERASTGLRALLTDLSVADLYRKAR